MPEFVAGFKDLANKLGSAVVGAPVEDQWQLDATHAVQTTENGLMWYVSGGQPLFLEGERPQ